MWLFAKGWEPLLPVIPLFSYQEDASAGFLIENVELSLFRVMQSGRVKSLNCGHLRLRAIWMCL